jgi:hypothetical protein
MNRNLTLPEILRLRSAVVAVLVLVTFRLLPMEYFIFIVSKSVN